MGQSNIRKLIRVAREANAILGSAGGIIVKSSFDTAKQLAGVYKDAGSKAFNLSKEVVKKTVELTVENQKELLKTSGKALKEVAQTIVRNEPQTKASPKGKAKRFSKQTKAKTAKKKKDITIDDLME